MERGSGEAALAEPEIPLARQQAVSEDRGHVSPEETMLDEVIALLAQDDVHQVRMVQEVSVPAGEPQVDDVSVLAAQYVGTEDVAREESGRLPKNDPSGPGGRPRRGQPDPRRRRPDRARDERESRRAFRRAAPAPGVLRAENAEGGESP